MDYMASQMDRQIDGAISENEALGREVERLRAELAEAVTALPQAVRTAVAAERERWCEVAALSEKLERKTKEVADENERLREALERAALSLENQQDTIACWGAYASPYFREKHDLDGDIESVRVSAAAARNALKA